jgi:hypothetical protein
VVVHDAPAVTLGAVGARSVAATVLGLVERGAHLRPQLAATLDGHVRVVFEEDFADVLIACRPGGIEVLDGPGDAPDLEIRASLPDLVVLVSAPLAAGVPNPADARGRAALARLADGRVRLSGSVGLARRLLRVLAI